MSCVCVCFCAVGMMMKGSVLWVIWYVMRNVMHLNRNIMWMRTTSTRNASTNSTLAFVALHCVMSERKTLNIRAELSTICGMQLKSVNCTIYCTNVVGRHRNFIPRIFLIRNFHIAHYRELSRWINDVDYDLIVCSRCASIRPSSAERDSVLLPANCKYSWFCLGMNTCSTGRIFISLSYRIRSDEFSAIWHAVVRFSYSTIKIP